MGCNALITPERLVNCMIGPDDINRGSGTPKANLGKLADRIVNLHRQVALHFAKIDRFVRK